MCIRDSLRILPDDLVQFLPVATAADRVHEDVLGRDERQFLPQMLRHHLVVDLSLIHILDIMVSIRKDMTIIIA